MPKLDLPEPMRLSERVAGLDWRQLNESLDEVGYALLPPLLTPDECVELIDRYDDETLYRTRIDMARYRFGEGEYKYFQAPLPDPVEELRRAFYPELACAANRWQELLGKDERFPSSLEEFLERCHREGQNRPTPLILKYGAGGYNCLHQDLYGAVFFPFQVLIVLNQRDADYTGGEFLLVEQRPRAQSRGTAIALEQGAGIVFPTRERPVLGTKGFYRTTMRHGVSTVRSGSRYGLGLIFHDAE